MFLIMSAAFIEQELESEFGHIPPSFLPLGNRRLFQYQAALAPEDVPVYLSVPNSFDITSVDINWLDNHQIEILPIPDNLSIGASLVAAISSSRNALDQPLHILYGDTLYHEIPVGDDVVTISRAKDNYNWAVLTDDSNEWLQKQYDLNADSITQVIDGYFRFSNPRILLKCIIQSDWDFIKGLNKYHNTVGLTPVNSKGWLDFGHVNTYYRSKAVFTTQRSFNELQITPHWIEKSSKDRAKIKAEADWFCNIPYALRGNTPQFLGSYFRDDQISYRLEYLHLSTLSELLVFAKLPIQSWQPILKSCIDFLSTCREYHMPMNQKGCSLDSLFNEKTEQRLAHYCDSSGIDLSDTWSFNGASPVSLSTILKDSRKFIPIASCNLSVFHGDFCFSNILYDFRSEKIKTIDPRGLGMDGVSTIYGDIYYDVGKLSHSVIGLYDWIIAGQYSVNIVGSNIDFCIEASSHDIELQQGFICLVENNFGLKLQNLYAMQIQLFLSMLPLHADNPRRQHALFANAIRLYHQLKEVI